MSRAATPHRHVEASARTTLGDVAIVSQRWAEAIDVDGVVDCHFMQLSLRTVAGQPVASFPDRWRFGRFEPVGQMFAMPAGERVRALSECRAQRSIVCRLDPNATARWIARDVEWTDRRLTGSLDVTSLGLHRLMRRIAAEMRAPGFASDALLDLLVGEIGVEFSRYLLGIVDKPPSGGLSAWRLRAIDEYLADHPGRVTLEALASHCAMSPRHLARGFKASRGNTIGDIIATRRIERACRLLDDGAPVKATAFATGFSAPTNFASAFRRAMGMSPRDYRARTRAARKQAIVGRDFTTGTTE